jgi:hypothetical protein
MSASGSSARLTRLTHWSYAHCCDQTAATAAAAHTASRAASSHGGVRACAAAVGVTRGRGRASAGRRRHRLDVWRVADRQVGLEGLV